MTAAVGDDGYAAADSTRRHGAVSAGGGERKQVAACMGSMSGGPVWHRAVQIRCQHRHSEH